MVDILVVDDDAAIRRLITRILVAAGHVVHQAPNGHEGLAIYRQIAPALVITDMVMDNGEGIETIRAIREKDPNLPILAISGGIHHGLYLRSATKLGATAALAKPFMSADLLAAVEKLLGGADTVVTG